MINSSNLHLVMGDIHANIFALRRVVEYGKQVGVKKWLNTGDTVGYGCFPLECVRTLRELGVVSVLGNHDDTLLNGSFMSYSPAVEAISRSRQMLAQLDIDYLSGLPSRVESEKYTLTHQTRNLRTILSFEGHTHIPAYVGFRMNEYDPIIGRMPLHKIPIVEGTETELIGFDNHFLNPGSVGYPRDNDPRSSFMLYDPDANWVKWVRLEYPHGHFLDAMKQQGFPQKIIDNYGKRVRYDF